MPLKYIWEKPEAVSVVGLIHGWLFVFYLALLYWQNLRKKWERNDNVWSVVAAFLPFGTFIADSRIYRKYKA